MRKGHSLQWTQKTVVHLIQLFVCPKLKRKKCEKAFSEAAAAAGESNKTTEMSSTFILYKQ